MTSRRILTIALPLVLAVGCTAERASPPIADRASFQSATIVGSVETPDPVLAEVNALEKRGVVKDVVVRESFPVQIRLRAPQRVIDELNAMPRAGHLR